MVFQDRWSLMAVVSRNRFDCTCNLIVIHVPAITILSTMTITCITPVLTVNTSNHLLIPLPIVTCVVPVIIACAIPDLPLTERYDLLTAVGIPGVGTAGPGEG